MFPVSKPHPRLSTDPRSLKSPLFYMSQAKEISDGSRIRTTQSNLRLVLQRFVGYATIAVIMLWATTGMWRCLMSEYEVLKELKNKERKVSDIVRYIKNRTDQNPNYSLLLGAGCSISSGVRSAQDLIRDWRREVYCSFETNAGKEYKDDIAREFLIRNAASWYNPHNEYASLFEKKYDLPRQRRMFVEQEVANKSPSIGYAYLTKLVKHAYFNTIFTTNFDDLVNEAFYQYSNQRPIVCAHDSSISSITVTSKRPKIIKLHGDYLFDDIKSTLRETESLEENMKNKLIEFAKDFGLIVVGYGGHDRSVMDILSYLLKHDEYFKDGIYWCLTRNSVISEDLRKLLWKDRAFYVLVDGFDEFFGEINRAIFQGDLPIETSIISNKSREIIKGFVSNEHLRMSPSAIVKDDLSKLERQSAKDTLFELIKNLDDKDDTKRYSDSELILFLSIEDLLRKEKYSEAIEQARNTLADKALSNDVRVRLLQLIARAYREIENREQSAAAYDEIIKIEPHDARHYLAKARIVLDAAEKLKIIDTAISVDPFYYDSYDDKAALLIEGLRYDQFADRDVKCREIVETLDIGIKRDPSTSNPCWVTKFDFISNYERNEERRKKLQSQIISDLSLRDPYHLAVLKMRLAGMERNAKDIEIDEFLKDLSTKLRRTRQDNVWHVRGLLINTLEKFNRYTPLEAEISSIQNESGSRQPELLRICATALAKKFDRLDEAESLLEEALQIKKSVSTIKQLFHVYIYSSKF